MSVPLQKELLEYGLTRSEAVEGSKKLPSPSYFGWKRNGTKTDLKFSKNLQSLHDDAMNLGIIVPDNQAFDLMAPANYGQALSMKNPKTIRKFLSDLLDTV